MAMTLYELAAADSSILFSPHCWRTRMALAHKGLEVETRPWRFTDKEAIAFSEQGTVPVLVDGQHHVSDSWTIALYLDEHYPGSSHLFDSPQARSYARFLNDWANRTLHPGITKQIILPLFAMLDEGDKDYFRSSREQRLGMTLEDFAADAEAALPALRAAMAPLRTVLAAQPYLAGDAPAYGDYIVFGSLQWARVSCPKDILAADDPLVEWRQRMLDLYEGLASAVPARAA
ncbi:MAG: glutathione S-transferase family protein [Pseudomonadota bacterium]